MDSGKDEVKEEDFHFSSSLRKKLIFGTLSGSVGIIAVLSESQFLFLQALEKCLTKVIGGCGGFEYVRLWQLRTLCPKAKSDLLCTAPILRFRVGL